MVAVEDLDEVEVVEGVEGVAVGVAVEASQKIRR